MVQEYIYEAFNENSQEKKFEYDLEILEASEEGKIKERLTTKLVVEASLQIVDSIYA